MYYNPLKVFTALSALIFSLGLITSVIHLTAERHSMQESDIIIIMAGVLCFVVGLLADLIVVQGKKFNNQFND